MAEHQTHDVPDHLLIQGHNQLVSTQLLLVMPDPMLDLRMLVMPQDVPRLAREQETVVRHFLLTILQLSQSQQMTLAKIQVN